jgi:hypothetical protein
LPAAPRLRPQPPSLPIVLASFLLYLASVFGRSRKWA